MYQDSQIIPEAAYLFPTQYQPRRVEPGAYETLVVRHRSVEAAARNGAADIITSPRVILNLLAKFRSLQTINNL